MAKFNDATVVSLDVLETNRIAEGGRVVVEIGGELLVLEGEPLDTDISSDDIEELLEMGETGEAVSKEILSEGDDLFTENDSDAEYTIDIEGMADRVTEQLHEAYKEKYSNKENLPEGASMGASSQTMLEKMRHAHGESASHTEKDHTPSFARSSAEIEEGDVVTERGSEESLRVVRVLDTPANVYLAEHGENPRTLASEYPECDGGSNVALVRPEDDTGNPGDPIPVDALLLEERSS